MRHRLPLPARRAGPPRGLLAGRHARASWAAATSEVGSPTEKVRVVSEKYPPSLPPKSVTTMSPSSMTRSVGSWCGEAPFGPRSDDGEGGGVVPSSTNAPAMNPARSRSVRPEKRSRRAAPSPGRRRRRRRRAARSRPRPSPVAGGRPRSRPDRKRTSGTASWRASRKRVQVWSPMAAVLTPASRSAGPGRPAAPSRPRPPCRRRPGRRRPGAPRARAPGAYGRPVAGMTAMVSRSDAIAR